MSTFDSAVLASRDVNVPVETATDASAPKDIKSMEYHRQVLQSKLQQDQESKSYVSPSDNIMSPCTAKLSAYRTKNIMKGTKPRSLFATTSSKSLESSRSLFADKPAGQQ